MDAYSTHGKKTVARKRAIYIQRISSYISYCLEPKGQIERTQNAHSLKNSLIPFLIPENIVKYTPLEGFPAKEAYT